MLKEFNPAQSAQILKRMDTNLSFAVEVDEKGDRFISLCVITGGVKEKNVQEVVFSVKCNGGDFNPDCFDEAQENFFKEAKRIIFADMIAILEEKTKKGE